MSVLLPTGSMYVFATAELYPVLFVYCQLLITSLHSRASVPVRVFLFPTSVLVLTTCVCLSVPPDLIALLHVTTISSRVPLFADVEGLQQGMDEDLIKRLAIHVSIPTTYAGGAKDLTDLPLVQQLSKGKIDLTIGSALDIFGGNVSYEECVMFNKKTLVGSFSKNEVPLGKSPDHQAIWGEYAEYLEGQRTHGWKD